MICNSCVTVVCELVMNVSCFHNNESLIIILYIEILNLRWVHKICAKKLGSIG